jgi:hypothetical protein
VTFDRFADIIGKLERFRRIGANYDQLCRYADIIIDERGGSAVYKERIRVAIALVVRTER